MRKLYGLILLLFLILLVSGCSHLVLYNPFYSETPSPELAVPYSTTDNPPLDTNGTDESSDPVIGDATTDGDASSDIIMGDVTADSDASSDIIMGDVTTDGDASSDPVIGDVTTDGDASSDIVMGDVTTDGDASSDIIMGDVTADGDTSNDIVTDPVSDDTAPVPGDGGLISVGLVSTTSITISWTGASDNVTAGANLYYQVVDATSDTIDTLSNAQAYGRIIKDWTAALTTVTMTNLTENTAYFYTVLVRDEAGNTACYTMKEITTAVSAAPVPGNGGLINAGTITTSSITINWSNATDDLTFMGDLWYKVVMSTTNNIDTLTNIDTNGTLVLPWTKATYTATQNFLNEAERYYFNVVVKDGMGNQSAYTMTSIVTSDATPPVPGSGGSITEGTVTRSSINIGWTTATDNYSPRADLMYTVVQSTQNNITTFDDAFFNGFAVLDWTADVAEHSITGLTPGTTYYYNVLVRDTTQNSAVYSPLTVSTLPNAAPVAGSGNALVFDGVNEYVTIPDESAFDFTSNFTVEAWFKVNSFANTHESLVVKGDSTAWRLKRYSNTNLLEFGVSIDGNVYTGAVGNTNVNDGKWHHAVGVYDGTYAYLYLDGALDGINLIGADLLVNNNNVLIGENPEVTGRTWNGYIDEVRIWNTAHTQAEINDLMYKPLIGNEAGLAGYWRMDTVNGSLLTDASGNNHDATMHNMEPEDLQASEAWKDRVTNDSTTVTHYGGWDADNDSLSFSLVTPPGQGSVAFDEALGTITYTPAGGQTGTYAYTYGVNDGFTTTTYTMSIDVLADVVSLAPLEVLLITPTSGATGIEQHAEITVRFNKSMNPYDYGTVSFGNPAITYEDGVNCEMVFYVYDVFYDTLVIYPYDDFSFSTIYSDITINGFSSIYDEEMQVYDDGSYSFVTVPPPMYTTNSNFDDDTTGNIPAGFGINGNVSIAEVPSASDKSVYFEDNSAGGYAAMQNFFTQRTSGDITLEFDIMALAPDKTFHGILSDGIHNYGYFMFNADGVIYVITSEGAVGLVYYTQDTWYRMRMVIDLDAKRCDYYINKRLYAQNQTYEHPAGNGPDQTYFGTDLSETGAYFYIDNIKIY